MLWAIGLAAVVGTIGLVVFLTPCKVEYTEEVTIEAPAALVYDNIRFQERLMRWSAWPSETGSTCACEGMDGSVGARTVFFDKKGERFGHQEIIALESNRSVSITVRSKGPLQRPVMKLELQKLSQDSTRVVLHWVNELPRPFNVMLRLFGIVRWTRAMHRKDLDGLKRYSEPPHQTYIGEPATELASV